MRKLRVLVLVREDLVPPDSLEGSTDAQITEWKTEYDVVSHLADSGHDVQVLGVSSDLAAIRTAIEDFKPHIAFNLLEEFHGVALYDQHVVSYLELLRQPYSGCNPRGLMLAHDKALSKKILTYHRVPTPRFRMFEIGRKVTRPAALQFPLLVKSLTEEASRGISQSSIVQNDEKLAERVRFVHESIGTDAIAEQYIEGRELYVGLIGNLRLKTFPVWEMRFTKLPDGAPPIATEKVKFDAKYQKAIGVKTGPAADLSDETVQRIVKLCKRSYRLLGLSGYARMDLRLTEADQVFLLEANPNPELAIDEEFSESAAHTGLDYDSLLQRILSLGLQYRALWRQ